MAVEPSMSVNINATAMRLDELPTELFEKSVSVDRRSEAYEYLERTLSRVGRVGQPWTRRQPGHAETASS